MEELVLCLVALLSGFVGGTIYGAMRSLRVGMVLNGIVLASERLLDRVRGKEGRRKARLKRLRRRGR